jgi:hypothetical protein
MSDEIKFTQEEWSRASDLACALLESLGPQRISGCEHCSVEQVLLPNYKMKYDLAKALRALGGH